MALDAERRDRYLTRLGIDAEPPSVDALVRLHRAHVERVAYETVWIHTGTARGIDPTASVDAILAGGGGYCFQLNGAFSLLLDALGYDVSLHVGGVHGPDGPSEAEMGNHLVLHVHGLDPDDPTQDWYVDAGLGDALHEPLPLRPQSVEQGPFSLSVEPSEAGPGNWHLTHDAAGSFVGMSWRSEPTTIEAFGTRHVELSTSPDSGFVRVLTVQRRDAAGADVLRGLVLTRVGSSSTSARELGSLDELLEVLTGVFGLDAGPLRDERGRDLWERLARAHEAWEAAGRP